MSRGRRRIWANQTYSWPAAGTDPVNSSCARPTPGGALPIREQEDPCQDVWCARSSTNERASASRAEPPAPDRRVLPLAGGNLSTHRAGAEDPLAGVTEEAGLPWGEVAVACATATGQPSPNPTAHFAGVGKGPPCLLACACLHANRRQVSPPPPVAPPSPAAWPWPAPPPSSRPERPPAPPGATPQVRSSTHCGCASRAATTASTPATASTAPTSSTWGPGTASASPATRTRLPRRRRTRPSVSCTPSGAG